MNKPLNSPKEDTWLDVVLLVLMIVFTDSHQTAAAESFSAPSTGATNS